MLRIVAVMLIVAPGFAGAQPLVITAPAAPGGGWDQTARAMQRVLSGEIESGSSVQVENVPGAAGTIGLARFIQSERGNPDALLVTGLVMVSSVIINGSPVTLSQTTPIARLTGESEVIVVPASSPFHSITALVDAFKQAPGAISWGGGSAGGTDDLLIRLLAEQVGLPASRVNYIAFSGGGAALAAVLGGQLSAAVSGYSEFAPQIAAGNLRALAVSSPSRVAGIDAPTLRESGIALDLANWRAIVAPPGLSAVEQQRLIDRLTRMSASPQWKDTLARNGWDDLFLAGPPFRQFLLSEQSRIEDVFRRLAGSERQSSSPSIAVTPITIPIVTAIIFLGALGAVAVQTRHRSFSIDPAGRRTITILTAALLILPIGFVTAGFVATSTLIFAIAASSLRATPPTARAVAIDLGVGAVLSTTLFVVFTRGLGVSLPGPIF
jgi:putative tricarboxylic transport membrane protein